VDADRYVEIIRAINGKIANFRKSTEEWGIPFPLIGGKEDNGLQGSGNTGVKEWIYSITNGFENKGHPETNDVEAVLYGIDELLRFATSLAKIFSESPDSIYVSDADGVTRMVNKGFERATGVKPRDVIGKNVAELEKGGFFRPSVHRLVLEEGRQVSVMQTGQNGKKNIVTGTPIYDGSGEIEMCVSSARMMEEIESVHSYYYGNGDARGGKESSGAAFKLLADSAAMKHIMDIVERIKDTDSTILISGESGVGKSLLAKYIHAGSNRAGKPLVQINCGTIPEHLLESELFGYNSGAFTGASSTGKQGLVEMAAGGTLLLDEISELPALLQVKLLNLIQDKQIMRIGAKLATKVDVRIIAASNNDLRELVRRGRFRADLYYRLNVIPIYIPALRERKEDIVAAVDFFVNKFQEKYKKIVVYSEELLEEMQKRAWGGNVRELENMIERMVLMSKDGILTAAMMSIGDDAEEDVIAEDAGFSELKAAMERLEGRVIRAAYEKLGSSYKVAEVLGISQTSAYRKIRKYGAAD
jgi:PAS domain S-box-containing protein